MISQKINNKKMLDSSESTLQKIKPMSVKRNQTQELNNDDNDCVIQSTEYLIISKEQNSYRFLQNTREITSSLQSIDLSEMKHRIVIAEIQGEKLKNQNLKLRIEKQNFLTKATKNATFKLVALKIEHQNLKKEIERLMHEKEMLLLNKQIKKNTKAQPDLQINKVPFKIIENTPSFVHKKKEGNDVMNKNIDSDSIWSPINRKVKISTSQSPTHTSKLKQFIRQSHKSTGSNVTLQSTDKNNKSYDFSLSIRKSTKISAAYSHRTFNTSLAINNSFNNA